MRFDEKIALVTGGASGIGKATVLAFARAGATVICADLNAAKGAELKKETAGTNLKVDFAAIDMSNSEIIRVSAAEVLKRYPRVDILVNGAGWGDIQPYLQNSPDFINRVIAINFAGPAHLTQVLLPPMIAANVVGISLVGWVLLMKLGDIRRKRRARTAIPHAAPAE